MSNVNHEYKNVFIHVPKCAGSSMESMPFVRGVGHKNLLFYKDKIKNVYFKWAFIRNPYDRLVSAYFYIKSDSQPKKKKSDFLEIVKKKKTFKEFVLDLENHLPKDYYNPSTKLNLHVAHTIPLLYFIQSPYHKLDFIGRFENLKEDWKYVCDKIEEVSGKKVKRSLGHFRKTKNKKKNYKEYYNTRTRDIVKNIYKKDLEEFDYKF